MTRLRLTGALFFGRACVVVVPVRNGVLGNGVACEGLRGLARFSAAASAAAPPAPAPPSPLGPCLSLHLGRGKILLLGMIISFNNFIFDFFDRRELRLLGGKASRGFRRVHLFAAVDHV